MAAKKSVLEAKGVTYAAAVSLLGVVDCLVADRVYELAEVIGDLLGIVEKLHDVEGKIDRVIG